MRHAEVGEALDYLFWVRDRILTAASELTDSEFRSEERLATRSLRATLVHQLENEWAWRVRLTQGAFPEDDIVPDGFTALDALAGRWRAEERELRAWFGTLTDEDLERTPPGVADTLALWRYLVYVVNHGTQQFSEAAVLLSEAGRSPGEIGYLAFCSRDGARRP